MEPRLDVHSLPPIQAEITVIQDDVSRPEVISLLEAHIAGLRAINNGLGHVLDLCALQHKSITVFTARSTISNELMGCAALKEISPNHGELKSMRTAEGHQRKGVAGAMIKHILTEAKARGYRRLSLETGAWEAFAAARALYAKHGFVPCDPYEGYEDAASLEMSVFMTYYIQELTSTVELAK